jgi:hypothetical protein
MTIKRVSSRTAAIVVLTVFSALVSAFPEAAAQTALDGPDAMRSIAPNVYLDCPPRVCDRDYIRTEIMFVNYVRDREHADVHILITTQQTGSGGTEYTLAFIGLKKYKGRDATLKSFSGPDDSPDQVRKGLVNTLKKGLVPYLYDTPLSEFISVSYTRTETAKTDQVIDPWNYWTFSAGLRGNYDKEDLYRRYSYNISLSANRTTEASKFSLWANGNFNDRRYTVSEKEEIISRTTRKTLFSRYVKSLGPHWSAGLSSHFYSSTFDNADLYSSLGPAIEFNVFPYDQSTRRELRIQYRISLAHRKYIEETVFEKLQETLLSQSLSVIFELKEPWGGMGLQLEGSNFFHDFSKNNLKVEAGISARVIKGFSFTVDAEYSRVRDQLSLPRAGASREDILLELKRLATSYRLQLRMGLNFRFGSIYSNVVNPRFGNM